MRFLIFATVMMPVAARAECLGDGCYDGLVAALLAYAIGALAIVVGAIYLAVKIGKRHGAVRGLLVLAAIAVVVLTLVGQFF